MKMVVIRQRPAIGDCLLLAPLISQVKAKYPASHLTVLTDSQYIGGALETIFSGIPGIDRIECIDSREWTTEDNRCIDLNLRGAAIEPLPQTVKSADEVYNCNTAFMHFEREHQGRPPHGIAEFWLRHFDLYEEGISLMPDYRIQDKVKESVDEWITKNNPHGKPMVGIVMRAGDSARAWNFDGKAERVADWLHTKGYLPVSIDPTQTLNNFYSVSCVGKRIDFVAALIARMRLVLSPDTGLLHLAQAVGTPQVALWGIMPPELRVKGYDCVVVPKETLGYCQTPEELAYCRCSWKFQQWSCLRRLTLGMILSGLREAL